MLAVLGAPERRRLGRRRREPMDAEPAPTPVTTGRATLVEAGAPLADEEEAAQLLRAAGPDEAERAVRVLDGVLHAHRLAARDPSVRAVRLDQAISVRIGWADGESAAEGRLVQGVELPVAGGAARPGRRASALRPQEHLAALLAGRAPALATESLALRAREDLDAGRGRDAALQLAVALDAALAELSAEAPGPEIRRRLEELRGLRDGARAEADAVLAGGEPDPERVARALERLEAALRARAAELT